MNQNSFLDLFILNFEMIKNKDMAETIKIDYPQYLADSMRMNLDEFSKEMKVAALVKLFELGKVSSGVAAKVLKSHVWNF